MKVIPVAKKPIPATSTPVVAAPSTPTVLMVVVKDTSGNPVTGAQVSITPSDASGITDSSGQYKFTLGSATTYSVTATAGGKTVTVPYYVAQGGATQLDVIPVYVASVEDKLHPSPWFTSPIAIGTGIVVGICVILFIVWSFFRRRRINAS